MRLATIRTEGKTAAARVEGDELVLLRSNDVSDVLGADDLLAAAHDETGKSLARSEANFAPVCRPQKVFCVGLNYRSHILEMGRELPTAPTLFAKFADALMGPYDDLLLPAVSEKPDWEAELGVVVGRPVRRASAEEARGAIGGYTVVNDVTMRDWQRRTLQWLGGKTFEGVSPAGPELVTPDECDDAADLELRCEVDGVLMQHSRTSELVITPAELVSYCSQIMTLYPGDLIVSGTPGGVGDGMEPPIYLKAGQVLTTTIEGVGSCVNRCVEEKL